MSLVGKDEQILVMVDRLSLVGKVEQTLVMAERWCRSVGWGKNMSERCRSDHSSIAVKHGSM
jgi:hypothetical protein